MKHRSIYLILTAISSILVACQQETEWAGTDHEKVEIRFSAGVDALLTKADPHAGIAEGQNVGIYVIEAINSPDSIIALNKNYKTSAENKLVVDDSETTKMIYFPEKNDVYVYAYQPYSASPHNDFYVKVDQRSDAFIGDKNYYDSDLLYASRDTCNRFDNDTSTISLKFKHMLSRITCKVKNKDGASLNDRAEIRIDNIRTGASLNVITGELNNLGTSQNQSVIMHKEFGAIIPPQTIPNNTARFLRIIIEHESGKMTYYYKTDEEFIFESGKRYDFVITVEDDSINIKYYVSPWSDGTIEDDSNGNVSATPN
ncbi:fimbrillin family protein [Parabacteroides sp. PF5-9]|uniref:fimbrillin family protein n=1 Tax=Parabacteroides sp. PF5-9 TaxID=1742404 RepID=UPI0024734221|nr:fimbrillin family protein [Parabacteroides sp. PF5-9]MDH6359214.1 hypothetical protein [Parabacteroides sp. PF5-9]